MSISISQTDNVGLTVESDPLALKIASNLSDLASAPTARTNLGVAYATNTEAVAGTSTTTVLTPSSSYWSDKRTGHSFLSFVSLNATTSGIGATAASNGTGYIVVAPTTAIGSAIGSVGFPAAQRGLNRSTGSWNWAKRFTATFRYTRNNVATDTNSISRVTFGKNSVNAGDLGIQGVGIRMSGSNALQLTVHNGTTFTAVTTTSSIVPTSPLTYDMRINSDGAGNVSLYVDDVLEATTSAGPTGTSGTGNAFMIMTEAQNTSIITGMQAAHGIYNLHIDFAD